MKRLSLAMVMIFSMFLVLQTSAQPMLTYDSTTVGTLSQDTPIAIYTFKGEEGDQITIQVIGLSSELDLSTTLQNGTEILMVKENDPFTIGSTDVRIDYRLQETSTYVIFISSPSEVTGDFAVKLFVQPHADKSVETESDSITINGDDIHYYSFSGQSDTVTTVALKSESPDFEFHTLIYDDRGRIIHTSLGTSTQISVDTVGDFEIVLRAVDPTIDGVITIILDANKIDATPVSTHTTTPQPPTETQSFFLPTQYVNPIFDANDKCGIFSEGFPNIRIGPSTRNKVITQVQPGVSYNIVGQYLEWYQVLVPVYGSGWVSSDVVETGGDCTIIPFISPDNTPVLPTHTPTITNTPTATFTATATSTHTPTSTPTVTHTPTTTDTPRPSPTTFIQIAPDDANPNSPLNILLGNTVSVSDFVSYPDGDTEDEVSWDVSGLDPELSASHKQAHLVITANCFGEDINSVEFIIGDQIYSCGDTLVDEDISFDTKTGTVTITAFKGEDAYTQWVLTGTATRIESLASE